jgi:hypothetical protein
MMPPVAAEAAISSLSAVAARTCRSPHLASNPEPRSRRDFATKGRRIQSATGLGAVLWFERRVTALVSGTKVAWKGGRRR